MPATSRTAKPGRKSAVRRPLSSMLIDTSGDASPGDASPGDASPEYVSAIEIQEEEISFCENPQSQEAHLDEAIALTVPASDTIAETPLTNAHSVCPDGDELMLDNAIALTFPASDPVAFTPHVRPRR